MRAIESVAQAEAAAAKVEKIYKEEERIDDEFFLYADDFAEKLFGIGDAHVELASSAHRNDLFRTFVAILRY